MFCLKDLWDMLVDYCTWWSGSIGDELPLLLSIGGVWRSSRVWQLSLLLAPSCCRLGTPSFRALLLSHPPPPPPLRSFGILSGLSAAFAISLLFIMAQTYEERWIPCRACVSASRLPLCVRVCALVWGRSTCSVVSVEERAELATLYVQAEVTAQAQWTPLRERVRGSPFWAPRNRWERGGKKRGGVQSNERLTQHSVSTQTLGLDVRNGRSVQPQEVGGLRSCSRAAFSLAVGASRSVRTKTSVPMCASCLRRRRHVCCLCLCRGRGRANVCTLCQRQEDRAADRLSSQRTERYAFIVLP